MTVWEAGGRGCYHRQSTECSEKTSERRWGFSLEVQHSSLSLSLILPRADPITLLALQELVLMYRLCKWTPGSPCPPQFSLALMQLWSMWAWGKIQHHLTQLSFYRQQGRSSKRYCEKVSEYPIRVSRPSTLGPEPSAPQSNLLGKGEPQLCSLKPRSLFPKHFSSLGA